MAIIQWVNLEKDSDYLDDPDIESLDRCGKLSVKTAFSSGDVNLAYKVKVSPVDGNVIYSAEELGRNTNFKMTKGASDLATDTEVLIEESIQLPAAGGNKYILEAKDANGIPVSSAEVEARRRLYCQYITMDDKTGKVPTYSLSPLEAHAKKYQIYLKPVGQQKKIPYFKTVHKGNQLNFAIEVKKAYDISNSLQKVGLAIVYSDYIAKKSKLAYTKNLTIGQKYSDILITPTDIYIGLKHYLWFGLDDKDDNLKDFFIDGVIEYNSFNNVKDTYFIQRKDISVIGKKVNTYGGYHQIKIARNKNLDRLLNNKAGTLKFEIDFHQVASWTNGFSWNPWGDAFKLITVSRRPLWEEMTADTREQVWNHEIGHRFGMTSYGNKLAHDKSKINGSDKLPDGPSSYYYDIGDNKNYGGHRGPHCSTGATYDAKTDSWSGKPKCVMFGADAIGKNSTPKDYCDECKKILQKLDLSA